MSRPAARAYDCFHKGTHPAQTLTQTPRRRRSKHDSSPPESAEHTRVTSRSGPLTPSQRKPPRPFSDIVTLFPFPLSCSRTPWLILSFFLPPSLCLPLSRSSPPPFSLNPYHHVRVHTHTHKRTHTHGSLLSLHHSPSYRPTNLDGHDTRPGPTLEMLSVLLATW